MRIIQLIDSLDIGGGERMAVNLANLFEEKGIANLLIASRKGGPLEELIHAKSSLVILSKKRTLDLPTFFELFGKIKKFKPTVIHAHDSSIFWAAILGLFLPNTQIVWHAHYGGFSSDSGRFGKKVKYIQRGIDRVIAVNFELLDWVKKELPHIPKSKFIGNFPDRITFKQVERNSLNWIISLANLKKPKNHRNLILAFSEVTKTYPNLMLALIGTCEDVKYLRELQELIHSKKLHDRVSITGPVIALKDWFDKARFAVLSSDVEGLPVSVLELGMSGVPIVCSAVGACPDLLENGRCGYLAVPNDVSSLASQMIELIENPIEANAKSQRFKEKVKTEFGGDKFFEEYRTLINQE
ncbi:MAG TPA: glycosyltransferase family 4 protein [Algoriphagus sp.]|nr:glycosyltransferase family 4 protein [Algoriphagus sp.]